MSKNKLMDTAIMRRKTLVGIISNIEKRKQEIRMDLEKCNDELLTMKLECDALDDQIDALKKLEDAYSDD